MGRWDGNKQVDQTELLVRMLCCWGCPRKKQPWPKPMSLIWSKTSCAPVTVRSLFRGASHAPSNIMMLLMMMLVSLDYLVETTLRIWMGFYCQCLFVWVLWKAFNNSRTTPVIHFGKAKNFPAKCTRHRYIAMIYFHQSYERGKQKIAMIFAVSFFILQGIPVSNHQSSIWCYANKTSLFRKQESVLVHLILRMLVLQWNNAYCLVKCIWFDRRCSRYVC